MLDDIPDRWPPEHFVRHRIDRELDTSLTRARIERDDARKRMPVQVRLRDERGDR